MYTTLLSIIDWFVPRSLSDERAERGLARNFVFTHIFGPMLAQSICVFLYLVDTRHGVACWTMIGCTWAFWLMPLVLKLTKSLQLSAFLSVETLAFGSLFGSFYYGGVSSPFLPWLLISLLLGFFYLSNRPILVISTFFVNTAVFAAAFLWSGGFPTLVPRSELEPVGWISIASAFIYMSWMAIYYSNMIAMRSDLQREAERHRITAERLQRAKDLADKASRAKSIFLAKMSHELRTPLNAVIGYSELLLDLEKTGENREEKVSDLGRISVSGRHLLSLVTDVLDLTKIEGDQLDLKVSEISLRGFVDDLVSTLTPLVTKNGNRFLLKCPHELGPVETDETKLRQVLVNLLSNAAKFTRNGAVTLTVARDRRAGGDWLQFQVSDTGIGIAESDLSKLFSDFGQATSLTSSQFGGTGLGLAISQRLCAMLGGGITVQSEVGRGSCFTVRLPAVITAVEAAPVPLAA